MIDLGAIDANGAGAGAGVFLFGQTGVAGLWLVDMGADTLVQGNLDGDPQAEFAIRITDGGTLASAYDASDFVL